MGGHIFLSTGDLEMAARVTPPLKWRGDRTVRAATRVELDQEEWVEDEAVRSAECVSEWC
jgi:hypothetical protein